MEMINLTLCYHKYVTMHSVHCVDKSVLLLLIMLWVMHHKHIMYHVLLTHQYIGPIHQCCHTILVMQLNLAIFCFTDLQYIPCLVCSEVPES